MKPTGLSRTQIAGLSLLSGMAGVALTWWLLDHFLGEMGRILNVVLFDAEWFTFPVTIQNLMWLVFAVGGGELYHRHRTVRRERAELTRGYLPEDSATLLRLKDLAPLHQRLLARMDDEELFLPQMIRRILHRYQSSRDLGEAHAILNTSLELHSHEIDLRYAMIRYLTWLIPTLGFIGTVVGIALAMNYAGGADTSDPRLLAEVTKRLAVAFNTTLVALVQAAILVFFAHVIQAREELALNHGAQYCLDNLINRLFVKPEGE